ncbi:MAG: hypothetical protein Q8J84_10655 [Flavobacteriaceae bacterium]|nr:hypothetical protein [Flavobacteriaceae bacterium]
MIKRISALFFILLANIILLAHSVKIHHHYDYLAVENATHYTPNYDTNHSNKHHHQHQSPIENGQDNPLNTQHEHDFPQHCHTVLTDFFVVKSVNQTAVSKPIKKADVVVFSITELNDLYAEPALRSVYNNDPFQIRSLFNPNALSLRGPPVI